MIQALLARAARMATVADAAEKTDETVTLSFEGGKLTQAAWARERGVNLRVLSEGRLGFAGSTEDELEPLLEGALASARSGEPAALVLPGPAPVPAVITSYTGAAAASLTALTELGRGLTDRLTRDGCQVNVTIERSVGTVRVANTRGAEAAYDVTGVSLWAQVVRVNGEDVIVIEDHMAGADLPTLPELELLVGGIERRLGWAGQSADPPEGRRPVCFTPRAVRGLILPVQLACIGKTALLGASPLADRLGQHRFDNAFSLVDDPLVDGRSGSRPADDEGVPSRRFPLVEGGTVRGFIYDAETATRAGVTPTGHARRTTFGKPQPAYSNLIVGTGELSFEELLSRIDDGLLVDELIGVGQGNAISGAFAYPVGLGYRVSKGEIVGRVTGTQIAGNAFDLLDRIKGLGKEVRWHGALCSPHIVVDGVAVVGG
ncbi:MAG TPA: metallopeptidase TldD-related protein [Gemmatimonadales bacterium]|nr:metallopeptidase TldD-related protein [Gemmatimonadales bacterium]